MIKQLQKKFIQTAMLSFSIVLLTVLLVVNIVTITQSTQRVDHLAQMLAQNNGEFPEPHKNMDQQVDVTRPFERKGIRGEDLFATRYISVELSGDTIRDIDTTHIADINEDAIREMVQKTIEKKQDSGWYNYYRFAKVNQSLVYVDAYNEVTNISTIAMTTTAVFIACMIVVYGLIVYFSKRAMKPLLANIERQKEFISNASHEIKTPLAVLSANTDVLEMSGQSGRWIDSNRRQIRRLNELIEQMLLLARFDEGAVTYQRKKIKVAPIIRSVVEDLKPIWQELDYTVTIIATEEMELMVDKDSFRQLVRALFENAIKYTTEPKEITIVAEQKKVVMSNPCEEMTTEQVDQLFERFYRVDSSRNRKTGGSGMGLSIAKAIATANKLNVTANLVTPTKIQFIIEGKEKF